MDTSPFACLPAETRNQIWELALTDSDSISLRCLPGKNALAETCYQVYHETRVMFFACNTLTYNQSSSDAPVAGFGGPVAKVASFLNKLGGPIVGNIKCLRIESTYWTMEIENMRLVGRPTARCLVPPMPHILRIFSREVRGLVMIYAGMGLVLGHDGRLT